MSAEARQPKMIIRTVRDFLMMLENIYGSHWPARVIMDEWNPDIFFNERKGVYILGDGERCVFARNIDWRNESVIINAKNAMSGINITTDQNAGIEGAAPVTLSVAKIDTARRLFAENANVRITFADIVKKLIDNGMIQ